MDRHGAPALVERDRERAELGEGLAEACAGRGSLAVVEGQAGQGKTALLRDLRLQAAERGVEVLTATGAELERSFAFGVVRQLFEPALWRAGPDGRERLFAGSAARVRPVFDGDDAGGEGTDISHARLHGLFWLCANLAGDGPLVLLVDDAHWADAPSMRFLDVLARRIEDLPVLLVVAARPAEPGAEQDILDALAAAPAARAVHAGVLGADGVRALLERALGQAPEEPFVDACLEVTAGNALLVTELVRTLAAGGYAGKAGDVDAARHAVPRTVARAVIGRLRRLSPDALAVARALAVLGNRATPRRAAALAELERADADAAAATLVRAGLADPGGVRLTHPLVGDAVVGELVAGVRSDWHRRAVGVLLADGAEPGEVAAHAAATEPDGDARTASVLLAAGRRALSDGAADVAVDLLRRALAEPPAGHDHPEVLLALGEAEARIGAPEAAAHLSAAVDAPDPGIAARAALVGSGLLSLRDRPAEGAELLFRALARIEGTGHPLEPRLRDARLQILPFHAPLRAEYRRLLADAGPDASPALLSHLAQARALGGAPAGEVLALARRALGSGALVRESGDRLAYMHAFAALLSVEAADELARALDDATAVARRSGSRVTLGSLTNARSTWEHHFGDLRRAVDDAEQSLELLSAAGAQAALVPARVALAAALLDRGLLEEADRVVARHPAADRVTGFHGMHGVRARLRLVQGRPEEALRELEALHDIERRRGWVVSYREPSRATLARALAATGRPAEGLAVADRELALARRRGVAGAQARAHLARAACLTGPARLDALEDAVAAAERGPSREAQAQALAELGAELRRAGRRSEAREPLRRARHLARLCGASALEERVHEELVVAGARPQRVALAGIDALTAAERRVATLAAEGMRNRDIAETLFVTQKTVEVHLSRVYAKLGIAGRSQLDRALGPAGAPAEDEPAALA
jgi:DNA-binding CsgD family transcriptional regulator